MTAIQQPGHESTDSDSSPQIHSSLRDRCLGVRFDKLTPEQLRIVFSGDVEAILRELIRDTRAKGLL